MDWREVIGDFSGLAEALVRVLSRHKVATLMGHNKRTINDWLSGAAPAKPEEVAWVLRFALLNGVDVSRFQTYTPIYDFTEMLSYEDMAAKQPPDLSWLIHTQPPPAADIDFCGIKLDTPLGIASSPLTANESWAELMLSLHYGLSVLKTRRAETKDSWNPPQIAFVQESPDLLNYDPSDPPTVLVSLNRQTVTNPVPDIVNSIGVPSESPAQWQSMYLRIRNHPRGNYLGLSVMGEGKTPREIEASFVRAIEAAKEVKPPFIELNLSCPNLGLKTDMCDDITLAKRICTRAREVLRSTGIVLIAKLPARSHSNMHGIIKGIGSHIDAVALRNTIKVRPVVRDRRDGRLHPAFQGRDFGGLSGPSTFEMTRLGVAELLRIKESLGLDFGIIAVGGVETQAHVMELLNIGADVVQACTAAMFDPLLGWKVKFHMRQAVPELAVGELVTLLHPRDKVEIESLRNAYEAASELQRRRPDRAVPYEVLADRWNHWMEQRPSAPVGKAQRVSAPKMVAEWVREFASWNQK
jgi:dihydroorotate dehydrogenase